jgi:hypothetical protein
MLASLFHELEQYTPALIGTFPLGLQIESSDLDIACFAQDLDRFENDLRTILSSRSIRADIEHLAMEPRAVVASFVLEDAAYEIFGQSVPVHAQAGFRHMIIEGRLLVLGGDALRDRVILAKRAGAKTEPAFARLLGLEGDPYAALLELERWNDADLGTLVSRAIAG